MSILKHLILMIMFCSAGCESSNQRTSNCSNTLNVNHSVIYSRKGTRSESRTGNLKINGIEIPRNFTMVIAKGKVYHFKPKTTLWGNNGYWPSAEIDVKSRTNSSGIFLSEKDLKRGWSEGSIVYTDTPCGWIYVEWEHGKAMVSIHKINKLIKTRNIKSLIEKDSLLQKRIKN